LIATQLVIQPMKAEITGIRKSHQFIVIAAVEIKSPG
jgi:hypothetical protein